MEFIAPHVARVRSGEMTASLRRWRRPLVRAGGRYLRPRLGGVLVIDRLESIGRGEISDDLARAAGHRDADAARAFLGRSGADESTTYLVRFHIERPGPADRAATLPRDEVVRRLELMDARAASGPWTRPVLALVEAHPGRRAGDLAAMRGEELHRFKASVRKLKALGLTESLEVGYRLTDLGRGLLSPGAGAG